MAEPKQRTPQLFPMKLRRLNGNKMSLLKFHRETNYKDWRKMEMVREDNKLIHNAHSKEEGPEFGAGSVYRQKEREELRRARFETRRKEYREEDQPWMVKTISDTEKLFRGVKEGGVRDNSDYFIFSQALNGTIEVTQIEDWYNVQAHSRFKTLDADEAEKQFSRRDKTLNFFSLKCQMKLKAEKEELNDEEKSKKESKPSLKISELDEWILSEDESSDEEKVEKDDSDRENKKRKKGKSKAKMSAKNKKKKYDRDSEAMEESDDGDEEGREREYISDSSDSEPEDTNLTSVAEEKGLKTLLTENEDSSDSSDSSSDEGKDDDVKEDNKENEEKAKVEKKVPKKGNSNSIFDDFSSSEDESKKPAEKVDKTPVVKNGKSKTKLKVKKSPEPEGNLKMKVLNTVLSKMKGKTCAPVSAPQIHTAPVPTAPVPPAPVTMPKKSTLESVVTTEEVRKYLRRKPITMKDLLLKFKSKGFPTEKVTVHVGEIVKKLQPMSQLINGKYYFSLEA